MNIIFITRLFPTQYDMNYGYLVLNIARNLAQNPNNTVQVICPIPVIPFPFNLFYKRFKYNYKHPDKTHIDKINIYYPKYYRFPFSYIFFEEYFLYYKLKNKFKEELNDSDVLYAHWPFTEGLIVNKLSKFFNKKYFVHFHASYPQIFLKYHIKNRVQKTLFEANKVIFVSQGIRDLVLKYFSVPNNTVIYNGIDERMFYPCEKLLAKRKMNLPLDKKVIISVGTLKKSKNIEAVINALRIGLIHDYIYIIIGHGIEYESLNKLVNNYELGENIKFLGNINYIEVPHYMRAADLLVQPSIYESFGQIFVEAIFCLTPVIGTNIGGIPEIIKVNQNGLIVENFSPSTLNHAINNALTKDWDLSNFLNGMEIFTIENMVYHLQLILEQ